MSSPSAHPKDATALERLRKAGLRPTRQRLALAKILFANGSRHVTPESLYTEAKGKRVNLSLATVYNCLETLVQCNLVRVVNFERAPTRYCPHLHPHAHFHDESTGATHDIELPDQLLASIKAVLPAGYSADAIEITFRGKLPSPR
jgi:Fur family peroxide stress response transcriptional regulator